MTTPATSALPRIAVPATVDMQDTVGDGPDPIVLPATAIAAKPTLRDSLRAELSVQLDETARWTDQLRENRNLLRRTEYEAWGRFLQTTDQQVSDALAANNEPEARRLILAAHKALSDLNRFFEIEKAQHLLATHAETGVRIYLVDNQLYFVSPDHKAFDYKANSESLKGFVRIDTQSGAIEQTAYQEEGRTRAKLPSRSSEEEIALLGCRIDRLALYERPDKSYAVTTKLRTVSPGFRDHEIRFSLADVLAGQGLSSNPNDPAVIQRMNAIGPNPAAQPKSEPESTSVEGATGHAVQGRTVIAAATTPMRVLDAKRRGAAAPALDDAARQKIETEYTKHRARVSALDVDTLNEPKAIAEALKTLDDERGAFREAVSAREKILRAELARTEPGSPEAAAKQLELQQLESLRASETMKTRALLERQAAGSDPIASKAAKVRLISMAAEVDDAYKAQISAEPTDAGKQKLTAEQQKFQQDIEGWKAEVRRWPAKIAASVADFLENNSWVKRIRAIGSPHPIRDYLDRTRAVRAADALKENPSLCAKDMSTMDVKAKAAYLDELAAQDKLFKARIQTLERQITSGTKGLEPELQQYREARAAVASRSVECAAEQIKDAGPDGQGTPKLRANYCTLADAAEEAYQQLEKSRPLTADEQKARAGIRAQREGYRLQQDIDATRMRLPGLDERDIARRDAARAEKKAEAAPAGPQKTEAEAARDLARTRQVITEVEARVSHLKSRLNLDRENRDLAKQLADAEAELKTLRITELNQVQVLKRAQIGTMTARIAEIDAELAKSPEKTAADKLQAEKNTLKGKVSDLEGECRTLRAQEQTAKTLAEQTRIAEELKSEQAKLAAEKDAAAQDASKARIAQLTADLRAAQIAAIDLELAGINEARTFLQNELNAVEAELKAAPTAPGQPESRAASVLQARKKMLQTRLDGLNRTESLLTEKRAVLKLEQQAAQAEVKLPKAESDLAALNKREASGETLSDADAAEKARLEREVAECKDARAKAAAARGGFVKRWQTTFREMRVNGARMIQQLRTAEWNPAKPNAVWHQKIEGPGRWMEANPMKAAMLAAGITEALHMTTIDWRDDGVHTPVPAVLFMLEKPLDTWGLDLDLAQYEFTTKEGGKAGTLGAEVVSRTGNVAAGLGAFYLVVQASQHSTYLRAALSTAGAPLVYAGAAYFGYSQFANLEHWQNDTDFMLAGRVSSPIVGGAIAGSFFGPPGAVIGAGAGAIGEAAGVAHALVKLDYSLNKQWKQRGVRDSIADAIGGYVLPENDPRVRNRAALSDEENEVIEAYAKELTLRRIWGLTGEQKEDGTFVDAFTNAELEQAGFIVPEQGASEDVVAAAQRHNWKHLNNLFDDVENNYNPLTSWTYLDQLKEDHPDLGRRFEEVRNHSRNFYRDLYARSMRTTHTRHAPNAVWEAVKDVHYSHWASPGRYFGTRGPYKQATVESTSERLDYLRSISQAFRSKFDAREKTAITDQEKAALAEEEWKFLYDMTVDTNKRMLPGLERILRNPEEREILFNQLADSGETSLTTYAFWTHMDKCSTGTYMMMNVLQDKFLEDRAAEAEKLLLDAV